MFGKIKKLLSALIGVVVSTSCLASSITDKPASVRLNIGSRTIVHDVIFEKRSSATFLNVFCPVDQTEDCKFEPVFYQMSAAELSNSQNIYYHFQILSAQEIERLKGASPNVLYTNQLPKQIVHDVIFENYKIELSKGASPNVLYTNQSPKQIVHDVIFENYKIELSKGTPTNALHIKQLSKQMEALDSEANTPSKSETEYKITPEEQLSMNFDLDLKKLTKSISILCNVVRSKTQTESCEANIEDVKTQTTHIIDRYIKPIIQNRASNSYHLLRALKFLQVLPRGKKIYKECCDPSIEKQMRELARQYSQENLSY